MASRNERTIEPRNWKEIFGELDGVRDRLMKEEVVRLDRVRHVTYLPRYRGGLSQILRDYKAHIQEIDARLSQSEMTLSGVMTEGLPENALHWFGLPAEYVREARVTRDDRGAYILQPIDKAYYRWVGKIASDRAAALGMIGPRWEMVSREVAQALELYTGRLKITSLPVTVEAGEVVGGYLAEAAQKGWQVDEKALRLVV